MGKRKIIAIFLAAIIILSPSLAFSAPLRMGLRELKGENIDLMEKFLLENEIANTLINNLGGEIVKEEVFKEKLASLKSANCETDTCLKLLTEKLNLNYLIYGSLGRDTNKNYYLTLNLYQTKSGLSFTVEADADSFLNLKKALPALSQFIKSVVLQGEESENTQTLEKKETAEEKIEETIKKENIKVEESLKTVKEDLSQIEKQVKQKQEEITQIVDKNPQLLEKYQKMLEETKTEKPSLGNN